MSKSFNETKKSIKSDVSTKLSIDTTLGFVGSVCVIFGFNTNKLLLLFGVLGVVLALSPLIWKSPKLKLLMAMYYFVVTSVFGT